MAPDKFLTLDDVNELSPKDFQLLFQNVIEHCPEAARNIAQQRPFLTVDEFKTSFYNYIDNLDDIRQRMILKNHPDLVGKVSKEQLSVESQNEQEFAGINTSGTEKKRQFEHLHNEYEEEFSFPFVICARENTVASIIAAIELRLKNDRTTELHTAIGEVKKICRLRLNDLVL